MGPDNTDNGPKGQPDNQANGQSVYHTIEGKGQSKWHKQQNGKTKPLILPEMEYRQPDSSIVLVAYVVWYTCTYWFRILILFNQNKRKTANSLFLNKPDRISIYRIHRKRRLMACLCSYRFWPRIYKGYSPIGKRKQLNKSRSLVYHKRKQKEEVQIKETFSF